jgi:ORF6N domain
MAKAVTILPVLDEKVINLLRDKKLMLDFDLAELYNVETKQLKRQVKKICEGFPEILCLNSQKKSLKT